MIVASGLAVSVLLAKSKNACSSRSAYVRHARSARIRQASIEGEVEDEDLVAKQELIECPQALLHPHVVLLGAGALIARFRPDMLGCFVLVDPTTPPVS